MCALGSVVFRVDEVAAVVRAAPVMAADTRMEDVGERQSIWVDYWDNGFESVRRWWVPNSVKEGSGLRVLGCEIRVVGDPMGLDT